MLILRFVYILHILLYSNILLSLKLDADNGLRFNYCSAPKVYYQICEYMPPIADDYIYFSRSSAAAQTYVEKSTYYYYTHLKAKAGCTNFSRRGLYILDREAKAKLSGQNYFVRSSVCPSINLAPIKCIYN